MTRITSIQDLHAQAGQIEDALRTLDPGPMPAHVQERLDRTYASLKKIPQETAPRRRRYRKGAIVVSVAAACALVTGGAFAATSLLTMGPGDAAFFAGDKNLPVFSSMAGGARELSASVGQTAVVDGMSVTLDSVSCDRNVANLYLTLSKDGGFDLGALSTYAGSEESEWARLEGLMPALSYTVRGSDGVKCTGDVSRLDAYLEGDAVKCLMRITPETAMAEQAEVTISTWPEGASAPVDAFAVGLDMTGVPAPRELGSQDIAFSTTQGEKTLALERFTVSSLATVMVTRNQEAQWTDETGATVTGWPQEYIHPRNVMVTDEYGHTLEVVEAGDGQGEGAGDPCIVEFAGIDPDAESVTFTPVLTDDEAMEAARLQRVAQMRSGQEPADDSVVVDVSQPGAKVALSPLGGYEITDWTVQDETVTIMMKPYGWTPGAPELIAEGPVSTLAETGVDPVTGQTWTGEHSAIMYQKWDYSTGEVAQISSYYKATDQELESIHDYRCFVYPDWYYTLDAAAAKTLAFMA